MDASDVAQSVFPAPFRSLARSIGGAEFAAVVGLVLHLMGVPVAAGLKLFAPSAWLSSGWIPSEWGSVATVVAIAFVVLLVGGVYVLGLVVDYWATKLWAAIGRLSGEDDDTGDGGSKETAQRLSGGTVLKDWHAVRTQHVRIREAVGFLEAGLIPNRFDTLPPWLHAQRWWWKSDTAASQFSDLQMRLSVAKLTGSNAALATVVALVGLWSTIGCGAPSVGTTLAAVPAGIGLWWVLTNPEGMKDSADWKRRTGSVFAAAAGLGYLLWILSSSAIDLHNPGQPEALSLIAVAGTYLAFGFAYVRMKTNALYHRIVRDATGMDVIEGMSP